MTTFVASPITPADFAGLRAKLLDGVGFFQDGPYRYIAADSDLYRIDVVTRDKSITWSASVAALPKLFKAVINGGYFSGTLLYARASTGVVDPLDVGSDGDVKKGGKVLLADDGKGSSYFFFGRDSAVPPGYDGGFGNPGASVDEGMGGLGPLILPNTATNKPLKFGIGNRYASNATKTTAPTAADLADCIQRNNNTYASIQPASAHGVGFCAVAVVPATKLLLFVIKPNNVAGDLDTLRDALFSIGCTLACFTDGSTSTCLAIDGAMEPGMAPISRKDNLIETGFGLFLYRPPPPTIVTVTFVSVEVFDDAAVFGAGTWTLDATVQGTPVNLLSKTDVHTGDNIIVSAATTVTVASGAELTVSTSGKDEAGIDDDLGTATARFGPTQTPRFGVGRHLLSTSFYRVTCDIKLGP